MKKVYSLLLIACVLRSLSQTVINSNFPGQNAWMPASDPGGTLNGSLGSHWTDIGNSGAKYIRIGGIRYDDYLKNAADYTQFLSNLPSGTIPIVQISYMQSPGVPYANTAAAQTAAVNLVNALYPTVTHFSIGNEPNKGAAYIGAGLNTASAISNYIIDVSTAIKNAKPGGGSNPQLKVFGPELSSYDYNLMSQLISPTSSATSVLGTIGSGNAAAGQFFIDYVSFHVYPFPNDPTYPYNQYSSNATLGRDGVKTYLTAATKFKHIISNSCTPSTYKGLKCLITQTGTSRTLADCGIAITEANLTEINPTGDGPTGYGARSFLGGQFWAEMMCIAMDEGVSIMNFWSVREGNTIALDRGYISEQDPGRKQASYYHFKMVAENFKGTFYPNMITSNNYQHKAYGYMNSNEIGILLMNQTEVDPGIWHFDDDFEVSFISSGSPMGTFNAKFDMGISASYGCRVKAQTTVLLKFDLSGKLKERIEYSVDDAIHDLAPKSWTNGSNYVGNSFIKDTPIDAGIEPYYGNAWDLPFSPDIWCRNWQTGGYVDGASGGIYAGTASYVNPDWTTNTSKFPKVFVRLTNPSCTNTGATLSGLVYLYYIAAGTADVWPTGWTQIGVQTVTNLAAGNDYVLEFIWNTASLPQPAAWPAPGDDYCLSARFVSTSDPMFWEQNTSVADNIKYNNNWAQLNIKLVEGTVNNNKIKWGNSIGISSNIDIEFFGNAQTGTNATFLNVGTITVDLGKEVYEKWLQGGGIGTGIEPADKHKHPHSHVHLKNPDDPTVSPYSLNITSANASIGNIQMDPYEMHDMIIKFNYTTSNPKQEVYEWDVRQFSNSKFTGAMRYKIKPSDCQPVNAGNDVTIGTHCETTLTAFPNEKGAAYYWYNDRTGDYVGTTKDLMVSPPITTTYELKVISMNGCVNYDKVTVTVDPNSHCQPNCGVVDYSNQTLSNNLSINKQSIVIDKTLRVPNNITLSINDSKINFTENAEIEIMPGGRLEILNSTLRACDFTKKWKGIVVKGNNSDLDQIKIIGSRISEAKFSITMDKVVGSYIVENVIDNGTNGIALDKCRIFTISKNEFYNFDVEIYALNTSLDVKSLINKNYFRNAKTAVYIEAGDFNKVDLACNIFDEYIDYAIYSNNSSLKDQGSPAEGAGNIFVSNSSKLNSKLRHNGNAITYYYDPSNPITLATGSGLTASAQKAVVDGSCQAMLASAKYFSPANVNSSNELINFGINLTIIPNPSSDYASILFQLGADKEGTLTIMDIYGKILERHVLNSNTQKLDLNCETFANGIYIISISNYRGEIVNKKMIITK